MIFVGLEDGKIALHPEGKKKRRFDRDAHVAIGNFLAKLGRWGGFMCSSSVNHPQEYGFPRSFDVNGVMSKAVEHAHRKNALRVAPMPLAKAATTIEEAAGPEAARRFPLAFLFLRSGKDQKDVLLVFTSDQDFETFLAGIRYGANLARLEKS